MKTGLEKLGHLCKIVPVETTGDVQLQQPIYAFGITGVFTKQLDIALLGKEADIAVHSELDAAKCGQSVRQSFEIDIRSDSRRAKEH